MRGKPIQPARLLMAKHVKRTVPGLIDVADNQFGEPLKGVIVYTTTGMQMITQSYEAITAFYLNVEPRKAVTIIFVDKGTP